MFIGKDYFSNPRFLGKYLLNKGMTTKSRAKKAIAHIAPNNLEFKNSLTIRIINITKRMPQNIAALRPIFRCKLGIALRLVYLLLRLSLVWDKKSFKYVMIAC